MVQEPALIHQNRQLTGDPLLDWLNRKVNQLLKSANKLARIDPRTEKVTRPLSYYSSGIAFKSLGANGPGFQANDSSRIISLNSDIIERIAQNVPKSLLRYSVAIFLCHEASHISQRIKEHEYVQRMKEVSESIGRERIGELDLRSDFLAVHTLSHFLTLYTRREYVWWFHKIWCEICRDMLNAFPPNSRRDKQQRTFGHLLMSKLLQDTYLSNYPLGFNAEMWPVWNESLTSLSIYSGGEPLLPGSSVNPELMSQILYNISIGSYNKALSYIGELWTQLPRR